MVGGGARARKSLQRGEAASPAANRALPAPPKAWPVRDGLPSLRTTTVEMVHRDDVENCIKLILATLKNINPARTSSTSADYACSKRWMAFARSNTRAVSSAVRAFCPPSGIDFHSFLPALLIRCCRSSPRRTMAWRSW